MNTAIAERNEPITQAAIPVPVPVKKPRRYALAAFGAVALLGAGWGAYKYFGAAEASAYSLTPIRRADIRQTISATGKVQAVTTVQVGTQVSGTVSELHADFNQRVKAGQIVARLDPSQIEAQLKQSRASLAGAEANVASAKNSVASQEASVKAAKANVDRADAVLLEATRAWENTRKLVDAGALPARQIQTDDATRLQAMASKAQAEAQYAQAMAQLAGSKSQLEQAQAQATQARAAVEVASVNLDRTIIRAPIDGVVVSRNVDVGQTVAASLQAPTLFLIANDLTKMQVLADIDEADVGQLSPDSKVTFTVDAFPKETFEGKISQIRLSPAVVQNVVTYTAVIDVANPKLQLKPGMTATVTAVVAEATDVLAVPNAALRFKPATAAVPAAKSAQNGATRKSGRGAGSRTVVWKEEGGQLKAVPVKLGLSDGVMTAVTGDLAEGDRIAQATTAAAGAANNRPNTTGGFPGTSGQPRVRRF